MTRLLLAAALAVALSACGGSNDRGGALTGPGGGPGAGITGGTASGGGGGGTTTANCTVQSTRDGSIVESGTCAFEVFHGGDTNENHFRLVPGSSLAGLAVDVAFGTGDPPLGGTSTFETPGLTALLTYVDHAGFSWRAQSPTSTTAAVGSVTLVLTSIGSGVPQTSPPGTLYPDVTGRLEATLASVSGDGRPDYRLHATFPP